MVGNDVVDNGAGYYGRQKRPPTRRRVGNVRGSDFLLRTSSSASLARCADRLGLEFAAGPCGSGSTETACTLW